MPKLIMNILLLIETTSSTWNNGVINGLEDVVNSWS